MRMRATVCRQCGAPLEASMDDDFVCCEFCDYRFQPGMRIGPPLDRSMTRTPPEISSPVSPEIAARLDELDREWEAHRGGFLKRPSDDHFDVPTPEHCYAAALMCGMIGLTIGSALLWFAVADEVALFVIAGSVLLVFTLLYQAHMGRVYQRRLAAYRDARRGLLERLGAAGNPFCEGNPA